ncbi:MAG: molybdopterin biosynthesis protein [Deltaproteobacteria bacterium]|uniref:Molybdopterin molybdenumtransferase n=1 Tax=Candidatus Zymogenus saltonus TaxID=2844893 RepID=A0A9D8KA18_9DELT|nr:molybdopterin biosynthesis protein [Candidatus Zymogenus saltonus]
MNKTARNIYLKKRSLDEAISILYNNFDIDGYIGDEVIKSTEALGRVTTESVFAAHSSPNYHAAAMDGIAVSANDTYGASEPSPKKLKIGSEAVFINTGNVLPDDKDAVIMIEDVNDPGDGTVEIIKAAFPFQHVRSMGEDMVATEFLLPMGHIIRPFDIGALLGVGRTEVRVKKRPRILFVPTGDEIAEPDSGPLAKGRVYESNSAVIGAMAMEDGAETNRIAVVGDDLDRIKGTILDNIKQFDIVIVIAGSSAGTKDYTRAVIDDIGEVLVHGINIMPGKPTILGKVKGKLVVGLPGYPVSAVMTYFNVIRPLISRMLGLGEYPYERVTATVLRDIPSKVGDDEFLRVRLSSVDGRLIASPLPRGAGNITTMVKADGIVKIEALSEGLMKGDSITAFILRRKDEIEGGILAVGSHDISLDLLSGDLSLHFPGYSLASVNVGSLGGITALRNGECHLAGSHLLDPDTGDYNIWAVKKYMKEMPVSIITLAHRTQGLIIQKGNPQGISKIEDLKREGVVFANRQRGSGTRILLDYHLKRFGIDPAEIEGYDREDFTHMNVAVRVLSGRASCGLGIAAAAAALDLDFIPIDEERYDLIIPLKYLEDKRIQALVEVIRRDDFKTKIRALSGYDTRDTGREEIVK